MSCSENGIARIDSSIHRHDRAIIQSLIDWENNSLRANFQEIGEESGKRTRGRVKIREKRKRDVNFLAEVRGRLESLLKIHYERCETFKKVRFLVGERMERVEVSCWAVVEGTEFLWLMQIVRFFFLAVFKPPPGNFHGSVEFFMVRKGTGEVPDAIWILSFLVKNRLSFCDNYVISIVTRSFGLRVQQECVKIFFNIPILIFWWNM